MSKQFAQLKDFKADLKKNVFDISNRNNITVNIGKLYPCWVRSCLPQETLRIRPEMALRFMPMAFPVQTKMRADIHFFKVPYRILCKDWQDYICQNDSDIVEPYHSAEALRQMVKTGELADYLNLPTTCVSTGAGNWGVKNNNMFLWGHSSNTNEKWWAPYTINYEDIVSFDSVVSAAGSEVTPLTPSNVVEDAESDPAGTLQGRQAIIGGEIVDTFNITKILNRKVQIVYYPITTDLAGGTRYTLNTASLIIGYKVDDTKYKFWRTSLTAIDEEKKYEELSQGRTTYYRTFQTAAPQDVLNQQVAAIKQLADEGGKKIIIAWATDGSDWLSVEDGDSLYGEDNSNYWLFGVGAKNDGESVVIQQHNSNLFVPDTFKHGDTAMDIAYLESMFMDTLDIRPLYTASEGQIIDISELDNYQKRIRINAWRARAYEAIYNAFYRNQQNDPFTIDGKEQYNRWIPNNNSGEDNTVYALHNRNYELDQFTSCVQSPQMGEAPLVGLTASGTFTFQNEDGTTFNVKTNVDPNTHDITGISYYDANTPMNTVGRLMDSITAGISINDFRNVNAYQRMKEAIMRVGMKYKDILQGIFGARASFEELDMPEFCGGISRPIHIQQINDMSGAELGDFGGLGYVTGEGQEMQITCNEHCIVMGILSIVPEPVYTQTIPKDMLTTSPLSYYWPQLGHIGLQPITYKELCPAESILNNQEVNDVFGYQRSWYQYMSMLDEAHGDFRKTLRDFILMRVFGERPELGHDFITISPDDLNNIFTTQWQNYDKICGTLIFNTEVKTIVPRLGIPRLEA